jgi:hypothetical protein
MFRKDEDGKIQREKQRRASIERHRLGLPDLPTS